jgi:hypothetical protein
MSNMSSMMVNIIFLAFVSYFTTNNIFVILCMSCWALFIDSVFDQFAPWIKDNFRIDWLEFIKYIFVMIICSQMFLKTIQFFC